MSRAAAPNFSQLANTIERILREIREVIRRPLESEFARGKLTAPQTSVMQAIFHSAGMSLKDLCKKVGLAHSTTSGIVDRLVARGLLERRVNPSDRRYSIVDASPAVRQFMTKQAPRLLAQPLASALGRATGPERDLILKGLDTLHRVLHESRESEA